MMPVILMPDDGGSRVNDLQYFTTVVLCWKWFSNHNAVEGELPFPEIVEPISTTATESLVPCPATQKGFIDIKILGPFLLRHMAFAY